MVKKRSAALVYRWRHRWVLLGLGLGFLGLAVRLAQLSIVDRGFLQHQSDLRILRDVEIPAHRGMILDRNKVPLAISTPVQSIWVNPKLFQATVQQRRQLAQLLHMPATTLTMVLHKKRHRGFVYLKRRLTPEVANRIKALNIPGVFSQVEYKRFYPDGEAMAHVVGFTNIDDRGQEGLELAYDRWLRGVSGRLRVKKDRLGHRIATEKVLREPRPGHDLMLSIDHRLQYVAYHELATAIQEAHAKSGSVVVLDAKTGEVLAMANYPSYNPNHRTSPNDGRYRNRAVTDLFEPGSTMKAFSVLNALRSGKYRPTTQIDTNPGMLRVDGKLIHDEHINHGIISVRDVIRKSSNIGVAKMTLSLPPQSLGQTLRDFGFGVSTETGFPGEMTGQVLDYFHGGKFELATLSFGYAMTTTALQLAHAYSIIAAHGVDHPVLLVHKAEALPGRRVVAADIADNMLSILQSVTENGGTGTRARVPGYRVAGKTGTANIASGHGYAAHKYIASFAGMAPLPDPRFVISVIIREPDSSHHFGGIVAAPVFSKVMSDALRIMNVAQSHEELKVA